MYLNYKEFSLNYTPEESTFQFFWRENIFFEVETIKIFDYEGNIHFISEYLKTEYFTPELLTGNRLTVLFSDAAHGAPDLRLQITLEDRGVNVVTFLRGYLHLDGVFHWGADPLHSTFAGRDDGANQILRCVSGPVFGRCDHLLFDRLTDTALELKIPETFQVAFDFQRNVYAFHFENGLDFNREFGFRVISHYYSEKFAIPYAPVTPDAPFATPPIGWMSWYALQFKTSAEMVLKNARRFVEAFADYAPQLVIWVDWEWCHQGFDGLGVEGVDLFHPYRGAYPEGLAVVAGKIVELGAIPALWIGATNDGQLNREFQKHPEYLLADTPRWCGRYWIDPSSSSVIEEYIPLVFNQLRQWGFRALKWDCLPVTLNIFDEYHDRFADRTISSDRAMHRVVEAARKTVGEDFYMLSCAGTADRDITVAMDLFDGARIGGDVFGWREFSEEVLHRIFRYYPFHNVCIFTDADNLVLRDEFNTPGQARSRISFYGLAGLPVTLGDALEDLSVQHVEMLRKIMPTTTIRPGEFCRKISGDRVHILNLACLKPFGAWNVVALLNATGESQQVHLSLSADLQLPAGRYAFYDFWGARFLGISGDRMALELPPMDTQVVRITPLEEDQVALVYSSRHITQGVVEIESLRFDAAQRTFEAETCGIGGETTEYALWVPEEFSVVEVSCTEEVSLRRDGAILSVGITPRQSGTIRWKLYFPNASVPSSENSSVSHTGRAPLR